MGDIINIEINRNLNNNPIRSTRNNGISNDTINIERYNIIEYINHDSNNKNNKSKQKEELESSQPLIIYKKMKLTII